MTVAIMQPYIFPYIGYFQLCQAADKFIFLDDVNYINKGWINRNYIQQKGNKILFTIPLVKASQNVHINQIAVSGEHKWKKKFFTSLEHAYKKSPFYDERIVLLQSIMEFDNINIDELCKRSVIEICGTLGLNTEFVSSSSVYQNEELVGAERLLDIAVQESADMYINPIGGQELYDRNKFSDKGVDLKFIQAEDIIYSQSVEEFVPWLSILDVLMYNSNDAIHVLLKKYTLI